MRRGLLGACLTIIVRVYVFPDPAHAQQGLTAGAHVVFYGDNTEFRNPFREGETIFGVATRLDGRVEISDRVHLTLGVLGNQRFGSEDAFELVRPIVALTVTRSRSRLVFGTLPSPFEPYSGIGSRIPGGPDRAGPHGLLPPMQRETLAFDRPYEVGLQWSRGGAAFEHDAWLHWQRLNTAQHRERFDVGARGAWHAWRHVALPFQVHAVHEGGQLFAAGPVRDSLAVASGLVLSSRPRPRATGEAADADVARNRPVVTLELLGLWSRYTPDRAAPNPSRNGGAFFGRVEAEKQRWRAHLIMWRGDDYIKDEGDANYLSLRRDATRYRGVRDYAEAGLTRSFDLAPETRLQVSFRLHRVERHYEYSYRVLAVAAVRARIK